MKDNRTSTQNRNNNSILNQSQTGTTKAEEAANSMRRNKGKEKVNQ